MTKIKVVAAGFLVLILGTSMMYGQATRTWVSGLGDDSNPCSRTAPCKTFAGAIFKTAAGGEMDILDPGGFGALTITKAITIDGGGGQVASTLVSGTNGIVVQAQPNDVVILRNLRLDGIGGGAENPGITGIEFLSGKALIVENVSIFGFGNNGIDINLTADGSSVSVKNTNISNLAGQTSVGIRATTTTGHVSLSVDHSKIELTSIGIEASDHSHVTVTDSSIEHASNTGLLADSPSGDALLSVKGSEISFNDNGLTAGPGKVNIFVADSTLEANTGTAMNPSGGGTVHSYRTNRLIGNTATGTFTPLGQQ